MGGDLLTIETACVPGKGKLTYTGSLGEVMQESIQAALTVVRSRLTSWALTPTSTRSVTFTCTCRKGRRLRMVRARATCTALVSCLTGNPVRADVAMTGEITLRGQVLPIGGLKENCWRRIAAALRLF